MPTEQNASSLLSQKVASLKKLYSKLSKKDKKLLRGALSGTATHDSHSPESTKRLHEIFVEMGIVTPDETPKQTDEQRIGMYRQFGLETSVPKGRCGFSDDLMCAPYDGVPYCVDDHGHYFKSEYHSSIQRGIVHREMMIERHHEKIKQVYEHCTTLEKGEIWVLCGGGSQLQAFFGCSDGYLAILYLSHEDSLSSTSKQLEVLAKKSSTLVPQFEHNECLFKGLKIPEVKLQLFPISTLEP